MAKSASVNFLPEELVWDILSRLPSLPLIRFRYVSRSWYGIISKLLHSRKTLRLAILHSYQDARLVVVDEEEDEKEAKIIEDGIDLYAILQPNRGFPPRDPARILGSYGGLLLLVLNSIEIFLFNPSTLQHKKVLDSPIRIVGSHSPAGFCYDSVLDDYKVIILVPGSLVYVASFKTKTWKEIRIQWHLAFGATTGTVVDKKIHWVVRSGGFVPVHNKIVAFHPAQDSFVDMPFPEQHPEHGDRGPPSSAHDLGVLDGCLVLLSWNRRDNTTYIWAMKRYGVMSSWTNLLNIPWTTDLIWDQVVQPRFLRPLFFTKQGTLLLKLLFGPGKVLEYNIERKSYKFIHLPVDKTQIQSVITFEKCSSFPHDAYF